MSDWQLTVHTNIGFVPGATHWQGFLVSPDGAVIPVTDDRRPDQIWILLGRAPSDIERARLLRSCSRSRGGADKGDFPTEMDMLIQAADNWARIANPGDRLLRDNTVLAEFADGHLVKTLRANGAPLLPPKRPVRALDGD